MQETKRRGRPARDENDTQSNLCTIKDPSMEPFYIVKDSTNFTVVERSIATRGFGGKKASGKEIEKIVGYYSSFKNALNRVAKEKFYENQSEFDLSGMTGKFRSDKTRTSLGNLSLKLAQK